MRMSSWRIDMNVIQSVHRNSEVVVRLVRRKPHVCNLRYSIGKKSPVVVNRDRIAWHDLSNRIQPVVVEVNLSRFPVGKQVSDGQFRTVRQLGQRIAKLFYSRYTRIVLVVICPDGR